jgi:hypothetical protein
VRSQVDRCAARTSLWVTDRGQLKIRDRQGTVRIVRGDQAVAYVWGERHAPEDWWVLGVSGVKPDTTHAGFASVARAHIGWRNRDELPEAGWTRSEGVSEVAKVRNTFEYPSIEAYAVAVAVAEGSLEDREQTPGPRKGRRHGAKFALGGGAIRNGPSVSEGAVLCREAHASGRGDGRKF